VALQHGGLETRARRQVRRQEPPSARRDLAE
jgi:hypothetical protein